MLAYRVAAHGLDRRSDDPAGLGVLELGVQDSPSGSARLALDARLSGPPPADPTADGRLTLVWSHRGAPHLQLTARLPELAAASWPRSDADAAARLGWQRARLAVVGMAARAAYTEVTGAVQAVLTAPMTKAELSAAVTARIAPELSPWCRPCGTAHVAEQLLRLTALPAGTRLEFGASPLTFAPIAGWPGPPREPGGAAELITGYLRLLGPATAAQAAAFLGTNRSEAAASWPLGLAEVRVDGRRAWLPADALDALDDPPPPKLVRLLPPSDPFLQARDRDLLVPERAQQKMLWAALGSPGAVLVDGDIAGCWRVKHVGRHRLELTLHPFRRLTPGEVADVQAEADRVGAVRGGREVIVRMAG